MGRLLRLVALALMCAGCVPRGAETISTDVSVGSVVEATPEPSTMSEAALLEELRNPRVRDDRRTQLILGRILETGSLDAADELDRLVRLRERVPMARRVPPFPNQLKWTAANLRYRITKDRKYHVQALLVGMEPPTRLDSGHVGSISRAASEGLVEMRPAIVALVSQPGGDDRVREMAQRAVVLLDIWAEAKTAEETFARAVERDDVRLKVCGIDHLLKLDAISGDTLRRVNVAMAQAVERARKNRNTHSPHSDGSVNPDGTAFSSMATTEDANVTCAMFRFWWKFSKADLDRANADRTLPRDEPCGTDYVPGTQIYLDGQYFVAPAPLPGP